MGYRLFPNQNRSGMDKTGFLMQIKIGRYENFALIFNRLPKIERRHLGYESPFLIEVFALIAKQENMSHNRDVTPLTS